MLEERRYCVLAHPVDAQRTTRAAALNASKWEVDVLNIHFLDGTEALHRRVMDAAASWVGADMAHLRFTNDPGSEAQIRIRFTPGLGSWSYLGTQAQDVNLAEQTMNFGWITEDSDDKTLRQVVLHEFGHAIGLIHEHQNPSSPIQWDVEAVVKDLSGPPNHWNRQQIQSNMFSRYELSELDATPTDGQSIMMYPIPAHWTKNGFSVGWNTELSQTDREFIRSAYPW